MMNKNVWRYIISGNRSLKLEDVPVEISFNFTLFCACASVRMKRMVLLINNSMTILPDTEQHFHVSVHLAIEPDDSLDADHPP
ncbi:hypothetical protein TNCV_2320281 [Trichonephila clavipes]|nr:hypothetical protein TNCV_2320281 [Trichonephila clavipes]